MKRLCLIRYQDMADKNWSLTDCASFLIMEAEGIEAALTYVADSSPTRPSRQTSPANIAVGRRDPRW